MAESVEREVRRIGHALERAAREHQAAVRVYDEGRVVRSSDGVLKIAGLGDAGAEEVLRLSTGDEALVLSLERDAVQAVVLGDADRIPLGTTASSTGKEASIPTGDALFGRVVDPLGQPLDGYALQRPTATMPLEGDAPLIHERAAVHAPLYTGTLAIDAMFPIGRGQRELIVGDEGTGKTSLALDAMLRQRETGVICVYVAIGRRRAEVWQMAEALKQGGGRWTIVSAVEDASPGLRYLAPYAGTAVAEHFMRRGEDALIVYDDLTAHAVAWRELSLLLRRPPGREAYPGDVFYSHSRLLERAAQLSVDAGGGSITALPLATLESGRLTAYIPTNLISITDGQIVLSADLFAAGQRPAIDAGLSVSRVGSKAQPQALSQLAGRLRLDYAGFLELEAFSRLGTRLEESTRRRIEMGKRVRRLLRARRLAPLGVADEILRLVLANEPELFLRIPEDRVEAAVARLASRMRSELGDVTTTLDRDAVLSESDRQRLAELITKDVGALYPEERHAG